MLRDWIVVIAVVIFGTVVIRMRVFEESREPVGERPVLFRPCGERTISTTCERREFDDSETYLAQTVWS